MVYHLNSCIFDIYNNDSLCWCAAWHSFNSTQLVSRISENNFIKLGNSQRSCFPEPSVRLLNELRPRNSWSKCKKGKFLPGDLSRRFSEWGKRRGSNFSCHDDLSGLRNIVTNGFEESRKDMGWICPQKSQETFKGDNFRICDAISARSWNGGLIGKEALEKKKLRGQDGVNALLTQRICICICICICVCMCVMKKLRGDPGVNALLTQRSLGHCAHFKAKQQYWSWPAGKEKENSWDFLEGASDKQGERIVITILRGQMVSSLGSPHLPHLQFQNEIRGKQFWKGVKGKKSDGSLTR